MAPDGSKRRNLAHESSGDEAPPAGPARRAQEDFYTNASAWELEEDWLLRRRRAKKDAGDSTRLPHIRTAGGRAELVPQPAAPDDKDAEARSDAEWLDDTGEEPAVEAGPREAPQRDGEPEVPEARRILEAQEELARLAAAINQSPDDNVGALKAIAAIGQSPVPAIRVLALLTQLAVYKDVIPGYRIRPAAEDAPPERVSKEIRQTRQFEQALVRGYGAYVKELARCAKAETRPLPGGRPSLASVAVGCACALVAAVPHFNFRSDLLRILVGKLGRPRAADADAARCLQALARLLADDDEGRPSLEAASLLARMMRARDYRVDPRVLDLFLGLRLLSEFAGKASPDGATPAAAKARCQFRTKRERKALREQKALDRDMAQADALVGHEERERMQSETLKVVFATYFRILKLRSPRLMGAVLEGLARYAHLINQDFFGDLLEALKDLIRHSDRDSLAESAGGGDDDDDDDDDDDEDGVASGRNLTREALLCTVTAFALLAGQDAHDARHELHLDLSFFTTHLFKTLLSLSTDPGLESARPAAPAAPAAGAPSSARVNFQTNTVLLVRSLTGILLPPWNARQVPPLRLAAFTKQLMTAALHLPDRSAQAVLALVADVAAAHAANVASLWHSEERKADGAFNPLSDTVEGSNPFASTVWEGELLRRHFSPKVREAVKLLEKSISSR